MKLLLDHNLSPRLVSRLSHLYPGTAHVRDFELQSAHDEPIWKFAIEHEFSIISKDSDFHQLAFVEGPPPKVIWIRLGNCSTGAIEHLLIQSRAEVSRFIEDEESAFLILG